MLADEGVSNQLIASQPGVTGNKVGRWRNRYAEGDRKGQTPRQESRWKEHRIAGQATQKNHRDDDAADTGRCEALVNALTGAEVKHHA